MAWSVANEVLVIPTIGGISRYERGMSPYVDMTDRIRVDSLGSLASEFHFR